MLCSSLSDDLPNIEMGEKTMDMRLAGPQFFSSEKKFFLESMGKPKINFKAIDIEIEEECFSLSKAVKTESSEDHFNLLNDPSVLCQQFPITAAQGMTCLSNEKREQALEDIHGVPSARDEDEKAINDTLSLMATHLNSMKTGTAYELAEKLSRQYVRNREFRLMFLRADRLSPEAAARRMIRFFELKKKLFGIAKLAKDIVQDDLDEADQEALRCGGIQVLSNSDMSGRRVVIDIHKSRRYKSVLNWLRASYYIYMSLNQGSQNQPNGIVSIQYNLKCTDSCMNISDIRYDLPIVISGSHACCAKDDHYSMTCQEEVLDEPEILARFRLHLVESDTEFQEILSTFGIPKDLLPISSEGAVATDNHIDWIKTQYSKERRSESTTKSASTKKNDCPNHSASSILPTNNDVLFGRGMALDHPGNKQFRQLVQANMHEYIRIPSFERIFFYDRIVQKVKNQSGRFLKRNRMGLWEEVDSRMSRNKVSHAFRNHKLRGK